MQAAKLYVVVSVILVLVGTSGASQDFKQFPGATLDEKSSRQVSRSGTECQVYVSHESFAKIYAFYKGQYTEFTWPMPAPALPSGKQIQWAFFILDGAKDLRHSRYWMKIQRPYIGTIADGDEADFKDVRDVSVIQTLRKR